VAQRNIDKSATVKALREEIKVKDVEIACLNQEKDMEQKNNGILINMVEEIGDNVLQERPHLEPK
ncbi:hypothetical protein KI387_026035, partial [Taxus chinensis]